MDDNTNNTYALIQRIAEKGWKPNAAACFC